MLARQHPASNALELVRGHRVLAAGVPPAQTEQASSAIGASRSSTSAWPGARLPRPTSGTALWCSRGAPDNRRLAYAKHSEGSWREG